MFIICFLYESEIRLRRIFIYMVYFFIIDLFRMLGFGCVYVLLVYGCYVLEFVICLAIMLCMCLVLKLFFYIVYVKRNK